ncbi:MAG: hypothetical protein K8R59_05895 [Thermoanaerobaculales bacterium]|nr:hypothetical protein [Thermoanaerobaculales bacterium]
MAEENASGVFQGAVGALRETQAGGAERTPAWRFPHGVHSPRQPRQIHSLLEGADGGHDPVHHSPRWAEWGSCRRLPLLFQSLKVASDEDFLVVPGVGCH